MYHLSALILILFLDFLALIFGASSLSISYHEAKDFFDPTSFCSFLATLGVYIFGKSDLGLRFFSILLHLGSCILMYSISLKYLRKKQDAIFSLLLFILLPGSVASALVFNPAGLVIFLSLLVLWAYFYEKYALMYATLLLCLFVDKSFTFFFLALFFYGAYKKSPSFFIPSFILFAIAVGIYGFDTGGKPHSYLLDTLGIFAACFSPLVFLYFFYTVYKLGFSKQKDIFWFIMSTTFIFCLLLSLRQKLYMNDFLPFCVICTPLLIKTLMSSYRVRLPRNRLKYNVLIISSFGVLALSYLVMVFNPLLDKFLSNPQDNFAYNYHVASPLAKKLKLAGIDFVSTNPHLALRLKFYGIKSSSSPLLFKSTSKDFDFKVKLGKHYEYYSLIYP